jgi:4-amino-4-deoxy-L-arabinose transferase-like glycosyltransferase
MSLSSQPSVERPESDARPVSSESTAGSRASRTLLIISLVSGLVTHGYNLSHYPLWLTDEGIYTQQAWSLINEGRLSPYTYFYDHAPAGWMVMAAWAGVLPGEFHTFGNEVNTERVLMLLVHLVSVALLFGIVQRFSGSAVGAFVAAFIYNFSPLAVYYQRQVLLDNLMVFWLLLSIYLLARTKGRVMTAVAAGMCFGLALVTKENAIFFTPAVVYLAYRRARGRRNWRFVKSSWWVALAVPVGTYVLFALLKNELFPTGLDFDRNNPPADHVSLLYSIWWQLNRTGPLGHNVFLEEMRGSWLPKDRWLLIGGSLAVVAVLWLWSRDREDRTGYLVASLLALGYGFYLIRGSALLDFYVAPLVPVLAMNVGILSGHIANRSTVPMRTTVTAGFVAVALMLPGGYLLHHNIEGKLQFQDFYHLKLTDLQEQQIMYVRSNIPSSARIISDDDIWTSLHDGQPQFPRAHSHFKASSDPAVRDKLFKSDWHNIDYVIMSNKMHDSMVANDAGGRESWILQAVDQHSSEVWHAEQGNIQLEILKINNS